MIPDSPTTIYLNNFIDNNDNITRYGTTPAPTVYYNSTEPITYTYNGTPYTNFVGNYWGSDYTGVDADGDGIGDTPYAIPGGLETDFDYHPLMGAWENGVIATPSAPVANFVANVTTGNAPLAVAFTDASSGNPTSWSWAFGDGATSAEQDPVHTYTAVGTYTVTLTVENAAGSSSATQTITVTDAPTGVTITSPVSGSTYEIGIPVQFSATATGADLTYLWETGDGGNATGQDVTYTYSKPGTYTVTLTVSNEHGTSSAETGIVITKPAPIVFNTSVTVYADEPIIVDNVSYGGTTFFNILAAAGYTYTYGDNESGYSDRKPLRTLTMDGVTYPTRAFGADYKWKFYDSIGTDNAYKYKKSLNGYIDKSGTYYIWYGDVSQFGGWDLPAVNNSIYVVELTVDLQPTRPAAPVANFVANVTSGELPLAVAFTDQSTNSPTAWSWDFGDGATSGEWDPVHTYTSAGTYTVNLTASSGSGSSSAQTDIVVTKPDPIVFNTSVTVYMDEPIIVDGVRYSGTTFFNILAAAGYTYTYADNDSGYSDRKPLLTLTMDGVTYPAKDFGPDYAWKFYETIGTGGDVKFKKALNGYISESGTYYIWYGDLSQFNWWDLPSFENSTYVVKLNVELLPTRPSGDGAPSGVTITSPLSNSNYAVGAPVHLAATATGDNLTYTWNLGNGDTVTGKTTDYTYTTAGNYTITLTVANDAGSAEASTGITIVDSDLPYIVLYQDTVDIVDGSTIMAAISPKSGGYKPGEDSIEIPATSVGGMLNASGFVFDIWKSQKPIPTYSLQDITTPDGACYPNVQNATADLAWRSFDGMTAAATRYDPDVALANGTTIYTVYGDYKVVKSDPSGAQYVIITTLNIVDAEPADEPVAGFTTDVTSGDAPLAVAFTDTSTGASSWSWAFGDGATSTEQHPVHTYTAAGTYTVTLTVANTAGSDRTTQTITVTESGGEEASVLTLHRGWNFVSTPKRLAAGANTFAIFNGVDTAGRTILLYDGLDYDWKTMGPNDAFRPLDGVWIYANTSYTIPLTFVSGSPELPPTKDLGKGWNAIGFTGTAPQSAAPTLLSLGDRWATLIGFNAETQGYKDAIIRTPEGTTQKMQPMQGYWIYMTQAETLAAISA